MRCVRCKNKGETNLISFLFTGRLPRCLLRLQPDHSGRERLLPRELPPGAAAAWRQRRRRQPRSPTPHPLLPRPPERGPSALRRPGRLLLLRHRRLRLRLRGGRGRPLLHPLHEEVCRDRRRLLRRAHQPDHGHRGRAAAGGRRQREQLLLLQRGRRGRGGRVLLRRGGLHRRRLRDQEVLSDLRRRATDSTAAATSTAAEVHRHEVLAWVLPLKRNVGNQCSFFVPLYTHPPFCT